MLQSRAAYTGTCKKLFNPLEGKGIPAIMSTIVFQLQWFKSAEKAMVIGTRNAE